MTIFLLFLTLSLYGIEQTQVVHRCDLYGFPTEILNHIASYLSYSNTIYETPETFIDRVKKSKGMLREAQLSNGHIIKIQNGNLELAIPHESNHKYQQIITATKWHKDNPYRPLEPAEETRCVEGFVLSPSNTYLSALIKTNCLGICTKNEIEYFTLSKNEFIKNGLFDFADTEIQTLTISNKGQCVVVDWYGDVLLLEPQKSWFDPKKISEKPLKVELYPRSIKVSSPLNWANKIIELVSNKQNTKLALKFHFLFECLNNPSEVTKVDKYNGPLLKKLLQTWFSKNYSQYDSIAYLFDNSLQSSNKLLNQIMKKINDIEEDEDNATMLFERFHGGIDESSPIKIISLQKEEPWTLAKYFMLRGVCKELDKQCGFKKQ